MLVGAVMGFWAVQRDRLAARVAIARRRARRRAMALDPRVPRVTLRANQIVSGLALTIFAGAAGLSSYLGNDLEPRRPAGAARVPAVPAALVAGRAGRRADPVRPDRARLSRRGCCVALVARLPRAHAAGPEPARGRRVAGGRRRDGDQRRRATATRTRSSAARSPASAARRSRSSITPQWVDGITGGAGLDRDRARHLRLLAAALCLVGAYFFGAFSALPFTFQARGI